jgi:bifunctional DNA-binding transcriptional regulator/antitoxin component of YhaV-PrlF toxin-antitoxin module
VIAEAPTNINTTPCEAETTDLDDGRVSLRAAIRLFGWNEKTQLSFTVEGNHVSVCAVSEKGGTLESKQGRCLIPLAIRRRLSMRSNSTVYVVTEQTPVPHVRIYPNAHIVQLLRKAEQR